MVKQVAASISVIVPVYNGERYVVQAIESILKQSMKPTEIVVIDDGSTDTTATLLKDLDPIIHYVYQENRGIGAARNAGVKAAKGELIAFLDSDDLWELDKLRLQVSYLDENPELQLVLGQVQQFPSPEIAEELMEAVVIPTEAEPGYLPGTMLCRREVFDVVGLFSDELRVGEFIDWYARAQECNIKSEILPELSLRRRIHLNNHTRGSYDAKKDYLRILKAALDRRRASSK